MFDSRNDLSSAGLKKALDHDAISANMLWLGTWRNQERAYASQEDERRAIILGRKQDVAGAK